MATRQVPKVPKVHRGLREPAALGRGLSTATLQAAPVPDDVERLVGQWLTVPEAGELLGLDVRRVRQLLQERQLLALRRGPNLALYVPAQFVHQGAVLRGLPGTLTVLADAGFDSVEAVRWLHTPDETLPGTPLEALRLNRRTEVRRRAQALAF